MNAHTVGQLVLLMTLMKNYSCDGYSLFVLEDKQITAMEGSCVKIKCKPGRNIYKYHGDYLLWLKDAVQSKRQVLADTIIYSTDESKHSAHPLHPHQNRVQYIDSSTSRYYQPEELCNILICGLKKTDSGNYQFVYYGTYLRSLTNPGTNLTVVENPCPITFKGPQAVKENEMVTLTCATLSSCPSSPQIGTSMQRPSIQMSESLRTNTGSPKSITQIFNVSWKDDGIVFSCQTADNKDKYLIRNLSLTVEYSPKNLAIKPQSITVKEKKSFSLDCVARFKPSITSFTWMKTIDGNESTVGFQRTYSVNSASPSDAGLYRCAARNEIGTGTSQQAEVKVMYAPKHTAIIKGGEQQLSDGRRSVTLTCISLCYPPATYVWYNKTDGREILTSQSQVVTVNSDRAGEYYCTARNDLGQRSSEPLRLFEGDGGKSQSNEDPCTQGPSGESGEFGLSESRQSRGEFLSGQPNRWKAQRPQHRPDTTTSASTMSTVYYLPRNQTEKEMQVNYENVSIVYAAKPPNLPNPCDSDSDTSEDTSSSEDDYCQAPPPQVLQRQQHGGTENESLNYVFLDFGNELKKAKEGVVYSKVSKPKPVKERVKGRQADYENASVAQAAKSPKPSNPCDSDSDTSEDEVEVSYTQVDLKPESGHRRASRDSSSSEDELQYSQIRSSSDRMWYMFDAQRAEQVINVNNHYAPKETEARISSDHVRKGHFVTLTCSAKGRPSVSFSWFKNDQKLLSGAELKFTSIKASDSGSYFCQAENKIGTGKSNTLYIDLSSPPTNVQLSLPAKVREGQSVTVTCTAESFPPSSFTVKKSSASNPESVFPHVYGQNTSSHTFTAAPAHAGSYVCTAANSKGTARSEEKNLEVQYAPKHTAIIKGGEQQLSDGRRSVTLTCISPCYPPATYVWYKKIDDGEVFTSQSQIKTVNSDQAGEYYCTARNDLGQGSSEPIRLFEGGGGINQSDEDPHTPLGVLWVGGKESEGRMDELVSRPPNLLKTRRPQPRPDATSASTLSTAFYLPNRNQADYENVSVHAAKTVNPPNPRNSDSDTSEDSSSSEEDYCQAPPPQVLQRQQHGGTENESLNYVFLDFGNELKEEVVYSKVSKPKPVKERVKGRQADYENASVARAAKSPKPSNLCDSDSDTSEDEVVVSYTQVDLKPESGHRRASRDSSSSEDELQYSQVKT
ncbi:uncharacterized protein LOC133440635 [Cololabis saira]|uniref:uncharacterized protein LOC133440635 n=1 Tax=Cololabis saira TaxID=129043 RepID=UPI002AD3FE3A|nr:uncharacterized protein LOC133440635 [Cololabis saira]